MDLEILSMGKFSNWREQVNVTYSYVNYTPFLISTVTTCRLQYGSTKKKKLSVGPDGFK
jgi:hypothetical protein